MTIEILKPIMNAGDQKKGRREIGLALHKVWEEGDIVHVNILYKRRDGSRLYPNTFVIEKSKVLLYPTQTMEGVTLAIVPIDAMKPISSQSEAPVYYTQEKREAGLPPVRPCWLCKGTKFWKTSYGAWLCCFCKSHPESWTVEVVDIAEKKE